MTTTNYRFAPLADNTVAHDWLTQATEDDLTGDLYAAIDLAAMLGCRVELRDEAGFRRGMVERGGDYQLS